MSARICLSAAIAALLSITSGQARAGGTSLVYTYAGSFDLRIPADPAETRGWMQDAVITVPDHVLICDLNVCVSIQHGAAFDLQLFLQGPDGRTVLLSKSDPREGYYEGEDYEFTVFDDEAALGIEEGTAPFTGTFRPLKPLDVFDGGDACGLWTLRVYDAYYLHTGTLDHFALIVTVSPPDASIALPAPAAGGLAWLGLILLGPCRRGLRRALGSRSQRNF